MLWTVVYKDEKGQQGKMQVEAENRVAVIAQMRDKGLSVVNVIDGPDELALMRKAAKRRERFRALRRFFALAALAAAAWYFLLRDGAPYAGLLDRLWEEVCARCESLLPDLQRP